ncbi:DUF5134 domain-containing protein [Streptomyces sp. NPDC048211]|uniref:DUF5134 domain-containing protein n=1 Tax=Streptomyces sp. NPDC048211 TaxID=3365516 RepID=UPI00371D598E
MSAHEVVYCMLTALFTAAAVHGLRRGVLARGPGRRDRVDRLLHAAMALAMAAMPWSRGPALPVTAQVVFFAAAALWFPLTAVGRGQGSGPAAVARALPSAAGMAAMAWMAWTAHPAGGPAHENLAGAFPAAHHAAHMGHSPGESGTGDVVVPVLALYLLGCAPRSLTRDMPPLRPGAAAAAPRELYGHFWDGSMALGTAIMLVMPH